MRGGEGGREGCLPHCFFPVGHLLYPRKMAARSKCIKTFQPSFQTSEMLTLGARRLQLGWFHLGGPIFSLVLLLGLNLLQERILH